MKLAGRQESALKDRLSGLTAFVMSWVAFALPRPIGYWLADRSGDIFYRLFPTYRHNVSDNLAHVVGGQPHEPHVLALTRSAFRTSSRNFVDMLRLPHVSAEELKRTVHVPDGGWDNLERGLAPGKGVVVVTAHLGAFDYASQILWAYGYRITPVTTRTVSEFVYAVVCRLRASKESALVEATPGGIRRVIATLRKGGLVGLVSDRDFFRSGQPVAFFGEVTTLPVGPARIARDTGAAIVPAFARRCGNGFEFRFAEPFTVAKSEDAERDIRQGLERIAASLEEHIAHAPEQWVMFQRVWPQEPPAALRVFPIGSPLEGKLLGRGADLARPLTEPAHGDLDEPRLNPPQREVPAARPGEESTSGSSRTEARPGGPGL